MAQSEERGPRIAAAVTGILSTAPLAVTLVAAMAAFHKPSDKAFGAALLVVGPVAVFATSVLVAVGRRWSGVLHFVALAVCSALGFFAAGLLALGGGRTTSAGSCSRSSSEP